MINSDENGILAVKSDRVTIRFTRLFPHSAKRVWQAITESAELERWFPANIKGKREKDAPILIISWTEQFPPAKGKFIRYEPYQRLEYTWEDEVLSWELKSHEDGSKLIFTNFLDDQAIEIGTAEIASAWHTCLDVLKYILDDQNPPFSLTDRISELNQVYNKQFPR